MFQPTDFHGAKDRCSAFTIFSESDQSCDVRSTRVRSLKVKSLLRPIRPALISGFCGMKRLGVFLLPPGHGWDASPSQGYPQHFRRYPFIHLGEKRHRESKVPCPRTQHNVPDKDPNRESSTSSNHEATAPPTGYLVVTEGLDAIRKVVEALIRVHSAGQSKKRQVQSYFD